jgi:hypothetical protein
MKRRLFHAAALVSLVLCVGCASLWIRSYRHWDRVIYTTVLRGERMSYVQREVECLAGVLVIREMWREVDEQGSQLVWASSSYEESGLYLSDAGDVRAMRSGYRSLADQFGIRSGYFALYSYSSRLSLAGGLKFVMAPLWFVTMLLALLPAIVAFRLWRDSGSHKDSCPACGYDLRGTP